VLSLENNLNNIFGFIYGEIYCPDENLLQVPFIQYKDPIRKITTCPRGKFSRLIFSEEIKYAIKYGYTINIEYCYQFKRGKDLFKKYILDHYEIKKSTKDPVQKAIAKLFLNSLYGRMGMKDISNFMQIVDKNDAENLDKKYNVSFFSELTDNKYLIKYNGKISENIIKIYSKPLLNIIDNKTQDYDRSELRESGLNKPLTVPSAVHIAAAIASYARIIINDYKNIPGNPCIMSDTDSAVLTKPLPKQFIGQELGQLKLEHEIKMGIFIKKKLYYILNSNDKEIIKSSGIDSSRLNYNYFLKLLNGETIDIERTTFNVEWDGFNVIVEKSNIKVHGLENKIKTIYNTPDVNFKFISFPIGYNIIVHPLYPAVNTEIKFYIDNNIRTENKYIDKKGFSAYEILFYILFLLSFLSIFSLLLYKIN